VKRDIDQLNLRNAFSPEPDSCHQALMQAACSVREDEPVKKLTFRTALIAALIIAAMMAVAVAATTGGLTNWFQMHYNAVLPQAAQDILSATEKTTLEAGPVTFTINELLCDGKIAYLTAEAKLREEGSAILFPDSDDPYGRIGKITAQRLNHPDVSETTTYLEAAQITGLPLYSVAAWMEPLETALGMTGEEMLDGTVQEDGSILLIRMMYFTEDYPGETLPVDVIVRTMELDLSTVEYILKEQHRATEKRDIPVNGVTAEKTYKPETPVVLSEQFTLTGVTARQTCAGVYVYICADAARTMTLEELWSTNFEWHLLDEQGNRYPTGASLTSEILDGDGAHFPYDVASEEVEFRSLQYMRMISADNLPEAFIITDGTVEVTVR